VLHFRTRLFCSPFYAINRMTMSLYSSGL
jgi:hypothetical protein